MDTLPDVDVAVVGCGVVVVDVVVTGSGVVAVVVVPTGGVWVGGVTSYSANIGIS